MGQLRDRMEQDLVLAGKSARTRQTYVRCARAFAAWVRRSPAEVGREEARAFLLHLARERHVKPATYVVYWSALKFLYAVTLQRPGVIEGIPRPRVRRPSPEVFTRPEVWIVIDAGPCLYLRTLWWTTYACGCAARRSVTCVSRTSTVGADWYTCATARGTRYALSSSVTVCLMHFATTGVRSVRRVRGCSRRGRPAACALPTVP
jgi:integrase